VAATFFISPGLLDVCYIETFLYYFLTGDFPAIRRSIPIPLFTSANRCLAGGPLPSSSTGRGFRRHDAASNYICRRRRQRWLAQDEATSLVWGMAGLPRRRMRDLTRGGAPLDHLAAETYRLFSEIVRDVGRQTMSTAHASQRALLPRPLFPTSNFGR